MNCPNLESVELPPHLKSIENKCFFDCVNLKVVKFPASLNYLGRSAFEGCSSLNKIDLSFCNFSSSEWRNEFKGCENLEELYLPNGVKVIINGPSRIIKLHVYIPLTVEKLDHTFDDMYLHFVNKQAPIAVSNHYRNSPRRCTIYIPKGSMTSYYSAYGDSNKYIEE